MAYTYGLTFIQLVLNGDGDPIYNEDDSNEILCEVLAPRKKKKEWAFVEINELISHGIKIPGITCQKIKTNIIEKKNIKKEFDEMGFVDQETHFEMAGEVTIKSDLDYAND